MRDGTREGRPPQLAAQPMSTVSRTRPTAFQGRGRHLQVRLRRHRGSYLTRRTSITGTCGSPWAENASAHDVLGLPFP
jgi:hypothetical protein